MMIPFSGGSHSEELIPGRALSKLMPRGVGYVRLGEGPSAGFLYGPP